MSELIATPYRGALDLIENIPLQTPYVVYMEPSGICNFKCKFCHQYEEAERMKELGAVMTDETFEKLLSNLRDFGEKVRLVRICGQGEPLINKRLGHFLKSLYESGVTEKIELITNGSLLRGDIVEDIGKYVTRVVISVEALDGPGYRDLVGSKIKFERIVSNIANMFANKQQCTVHVKIPNISVKLEEEKEKFVSIFKNISDEMNIENIVPLWPEMNIENTLVPLIKNKEKTRWNTDWAEKKVCVQIFKGLQVCADGDVVPCCVDWDRVNLLGNINQTPLKHLWLGHLMKDLQNEHLRGNKDKISPCSDCTMNDYGDQDNLDSLMNKMEIR